MWELLAFACVVMMAGATGLAQGTQSEVKVAPEMLRRAEELKSLKWGMFVCWSFSTFSGKEHTVEKNLPPSFFKAQAVDTDQWARTAKEVGMGYILFLTKHVDGFCLWDTQTTQHKVTNAPLGKDVLKLLRQSCDKYGIKLALYFCEGDIFGNRPEVKKAQLKELLTQYGDVEYLWLDRGFGSDGGLSHVDTVAWCRQWQPRTLIGFNSGQPAGEISLRERGGPGPLGDLRCAATNRVNEESYKGYLLAEFAYPILPAHKGGANWFYSLPEHDGLCTSAEQLYRHYLGAVKYGNIFSIDVGPNYEGRLRDIDVRILQQVGTMIENTPPPLPSSLAKGKPARASSIWSTEYDAAKALDDDESTRWGAASGSRSGWLEVDLLSEQTIDSATIVEKSFPRTLAFAIEVERAGGWEKVVEGKAVGKEQRLKFPPVKARLIRLNILEASGEPTINEFYVHGAGVPASAGAK
jgi:alpha-L-fucosidase